MKTANMIHILRCAAKDKHECKHCHCREECDQIVFKFDTDPHDWPNELADRMEQLLVHLRSTKEQNGKLANDVAFWKHRYESLLKDISKVVHERELLDHLNK